MVADGAMAQVKVHRFGWATGDESKEYGEVGIEKEQFVLLQRVEADEQRIRR